MSVRLPFVQELIPGMRPGPSRESAEKWYDQLKNPEIRTGKVEPRPCVVLPRRLDDTVHYTARGRDICLMATFEKADLEQEKAPGVPKIYREFVVPVLPNSGNDKFGSPIRTCPEWCFDPQQWIIVVPVAPKTGNSRALPKWSSNGVHLCESMLHELVEACRDKHLIWEEKLIEGSVDAQDYYDDLKVQVKEAFQSIPSRYVNGSVRSRQSYNGNSSLRSESMSHFSPPGDMTCSTGLFAKNNSPQTRPISISLEPSAPTPSTGLFAKNSPKQVDPTSRPLPKTTELQVNFKTLSVTEQLARPRKSRSFRSIVSSSWRATVAPSIAEEPVIDNDGWTPQVDKQKHLQ
ncbi:hypothetical protein C8R43DRAFT_1106879 [Mycena crocata]|nr:hypothetical protein C8R43DRAFT_1106879 [Mycena crocata]